MTTEEMIDAGNRLFEETVKSVTRDGYVNTGNLAAIISLVFKRAFAIAEKKTGIDDTRKAFYKPMEYMLDIMNNGAWDEENQKMK